MRKYNKEYIHNARNLRKNATKEENHLWYDFLRDHPLKFVRQKVVENYILDFYCPSKKLAIEIDGSQHFQETGSHYDINRTRVINKYGISVLRFSNNDINRQFSSVCEHIDNYIKLLDEKQTIINQSVQDRGY